MADLAACLGALDAHFADGALRYSPGLAGVLSRLVELLHSAGHPEDAVRCQILLIAVLEFERSDCPNKAGKPVPLSTIHIDGSAVEVEDRAVGQEDAEEIYTGIREEMERLLKARDDEERRANSGRAGRQR